MMASAADTVLLHRCACHLVPGGICWRCPAVALGASVLWLLLVFTLRTPSGLTRTIYRDTGFSGGVSHVDVVPDVDLRFTDRPHGPRRFFSARWAGVWHVDRAGAYDLFLGADDAAVLRIDGEVVLERGAGDWVSRRLPSRAS